MLGEQCSAPESFAKVNPMSKPRTTIDWGYPTPADGPIPAFNNIEEEAEFWDTHGFTESGDIELLSADELAQLDKATHSGGGAGSRSHDAGQVP